MRWKPWRACIDCRLLGQAWVAAATCTESSPNQPSGLRWCSSQDIGKLLKPNIGNICLRRILSVLSTPGRSRRHLWQSLPPAS